MYQPDSTGSLQIHQLIIRLVAVFAIVLALVFSLIGTPANAKSIYTINADDSTVTVELESDENTDTNEQLSEALEEAGVALSATDVVDVDIDKVTSEETEEVDVNVDVSVTRAEYASLTVDKSFTTILLQEGDTVKDVLKRANIELGKDDIVSMKLKEKVKGGDSIVVNRVELSYYDEVETSDYDTARVADPNSYIGTEYIKQEGRPGTVTRTYEKKSIDGGEPVVTLVNTEYTDMVTEVTAYGTHVYTSGANSLSASHNYLTNVDKENGTITLADGSTYGYRSVSENFSATAYCGGGTTSTGRKAQVGVVAVDPSVIPYGTRMYIQSGSTVYGVCVAGDCGVHGNLIDLYFNSESHCRAFGRRGITVYFLD